VPSVCVCALPAARVLAIVVVGDIGLFVALVTARALDVVVAALHAGSSVFLVGWLVSACCVAPALGAFRGVVCHKFIPTAVRRS